ncbi:MAG TPA: hypothetical protein VM095_16825, partial [Pyrinomonadaceae bacterium]|nr:hypothetical protein [Pyrinomonadaceae bacterium]
VEGESLIWETLPITIKAPKAGEQDQLTVTPVFLANVPSKKKRANFFVGRKVGVASADAKSTVERKPGGQ